MQIRVIPLGRHAQLGQPGQDVDDLQLVVEVGSWAREAGRPASRRSSQVFSPRIV
jgi:hypothetical protein